MGLAQAMVAGEATPEGPTPPELTSKQWSLLPPIVLDSTPSGVPQCYVSRPHDSGSCQAIMHLLPRLAHLKLTSEQGSLLALVYCVSPHLVCLVLTPSAQEIWGS